jgi:hypothetical protein
MFTSGTVFGAVAGGFLIAQTIVWAGEIRTVGFKQWVRAGVTKSYAQYFSLLSPRQRWRLVSLWVLFGVEILVASSFL